MGQLPLPQKGGHGTRAGHLCLSQGPGASPSACRARVRAPRASCVSAPGKDPHRPEITRLPAPCVPSRTARPSCSPGSSLAGPFLPAPEPQACPRLRFPVWLSRGWPGGPPAVRSGHWRLPKPAWGGRTPAFLRGNNAGQQQPTGRGLGVSGRRRRVGAGESRATHRWGGTREAWAGAEAPVIPGRWLWGSLL